MRAMPSCMAESVELCSKLPLARLGDEKIAEDLNFFGGLQLLGEHEVDRYGRQLHVAQHRYEVRFFFREVIGHQANTDAGPDGVLHRNNAVGGERRLARWLA